MTSNTAQYAPPVNQLLSLGQPKGHDFTRDYATLGIEPEHVPELLRMVVDGGLHNASGKSSLVWAPVHAWRALAQLKAESAIEPLLGLLQRIDEHNDDWVGTEVPRVLGELGHAALEPVMAYLANPAHNEWARVAAAKAVAEIGARHGELWAECVARLSAQLDKFMEQSEMLNAFLVSSLLDLKAGEALPVMARAFAVGRVDESVAGDFEDVEIELGLKKQRQHPRKPNELTELGDKLRALAGGSQMVDAILEDENGAERPPATQNSGKPGRNDPCPCGSGKKFKKCCGKA
jgi:uncharacterized protein YecA (UPF0149 family)